MKELIVSLKDDENFTACIGLSYKGSIYPDISRVTLLS